MRKHEPQIYAQIAHVLLPKDYVRFRLTGGYAVDKADGAGMLLFDLQKRDWSDESFGDPGNPPRLDAPNLRRAGNHRRDHARSCGGNRLKAGTPVVGGGGDQAAQAVGVGAVTPGIVALTLGTSGWFLLPHRGPFVEPQGRLHAFCHSVPGAWHFMGVMLSAAGSLQWYRDTLAAGVSFR